MKPWLLLLACTCMVLEDLAGQTDWIRMPQEELLALDGKLSPDHPDRVPVWNELGFRAFDDNRLEEASSYALKAAELAVTLPTPDFLGQADSWVILGHIARVTGAFALAESYYNQALGIREEYEYYWGAASCLNSLAVLYLDYKGNYEKGAAYGERGLEVLKLSQRSDKDNNRLAARLYGNLGDLYCRAEKYDEAEIAFRKGLSLGTPDQIAEQMADIHINRGACWTEVESYLAAEEEFQQALHIYGDSSDSVGLAKTYFQLMYNAMEQNNFDLAENYQQMLGAFEEKLDQTERAMLLKNKGRIRDVRGAHDVAINYYQQALQEFVQLNNPVELAKLHFDLGRIFHDGHKYSRALSHLEQSQQLIESRSSDLPDLAADIDNFLPLTIRAQKQRNLLFIILSFAALAIITAAFIAYISYQKRQLVQARALQTEQSLNNALQELEIERNYQHLEDSERVLNWVARELHDRLGAMLSTIKLYFDDFNKKLDTVQEENMSQFNKANALLDDVCEEVRRISRGALPANLPDRGLVKEVEYLLNHIRDTRQMEVEFVTNGKKQRLNTAKERKLYRIINILINNIMVHSKATWFSLQINHFGDQMQIMVEDNGEGFDLEAVLKKEGTGIKNLFSLAAELGAKVDFDTEPGKGTAVTIEMPILKDSLLTASAP